MFLQGLLWLTVCPEALTHCGCIHRQRGQFTLTFCSNMMEVQVLLSVETGRRNKELMNLLIVQQLFKYICLTSTCHF